MYTNVILIKMAAEKNLPGTGWKFTSEISHTYLFFVIYQYIMYISNYSQKLARPNLAELSQRGRRSNLNGGRSRSICMSVVEAA